MSMIGNYVMIDSDSLDKILDNNEIITEYLCSDDDEATLDIDKSWQAIAYVLTGDICDGEPPLAYVVPQCEDNFIDCADYGAYYLTTEQVNQTYDAIKDISIEDFKEMYNFDELVENEIYPITDNDEADDFFEYLTNYFIPIKEFYKEATSANRAILFYIS